MSDAADSRFAPPMTPVADVPDPSEVGPLQASRGVRLLAVLIDGLVLGAAVWALAQIPFFAPIQYSDQDPWSSFSPLTMLFSFSLFVVVQGWLLVRRGQTLGKKLMHIRIVRGDGGDATAWQLLGLRYGVGYLAAINLPLSMVYTVVDGLLIFRSSHRCLHDSIADTRVVRC